MAYKTYRVERGALGNAIHRCKSTKHPQYDDYGGRGIKVCDEWIGPEGFKRFLEHIGPKPDPKLTLDRINNDGNYEPGNVRWASRKEQSVNRRLKPVVFSDERRQKLSEAQLRRRARERGEPV